MEGCISLCFDLIPLPSAVGMSGAKLAQVA